MTRKKHDHTFSIELNQLDSLKTLEISDRDRGFIAIEGHLGEKVQLRIVENVLLEILSPLGVLRIDIDESMLSEMKLDE